MPFENKKTILLVEDEAISAILEKKQLESYGYRVHHVVSGEEAIRVVLEDLLPIDLILMDIDLGHGIDGTQASEIILNTRDLPIVFLSSHTEPEIVGKTEKITSYGYVVKNSGIIILDASIKMAFKLFDAHQKLKHELSVRKQIEDEMRKSKARMSSAIKVAELCFYEEEGIDKSSRQMTFLNALAILLLGIPKDQEYRARDFWIERIHPEDLENVMIPAIIKFEEKGVDIVSAEYRYQNDKLGEIWFRHVAHALERDKNGGIIRLVGVFQDITRLKELELLVSKSQGL